MNKIKDLEYFSKLNYNVILKRINNIYYLFIPELSLVAEGKNPDEAYEKLEKEKKVHFERIIEMNAQDTIKEPMDMILRKRMFTDLLPFFIKISLVAVIIVISIIGSLHFVNVFINRKIIQVAIITRSLVTELPAKVDHKLNNMSAEEKEEIRLRLRSMIQQMKPFVDEFRILWEDESTGRLKGSEHVTKGNASN